MLITTALFTAAAFAGEPPKLVPRPIPGMAALAHTSVQSPKVNTPTIQREAALNVPNKDQARILFIYRRSTLPSELTRNLSAPKSEINPKSIVTPVNSTTLRIIPQQKLQQATQSKR